LGKGGFVGRWIGGKFQAEVGSSNPRSKVLAGQVRVGLVKTFIYLAGNFLTLGFQETNLTFQKGRARVIKVRSVQSGPVRPSVRSVRSVRPSVHPSVCPSVHQSVSKLVGGGGGGGGGGGERSVSSSSSSSSPVQASPASPVESSPVSQSSPSPGGWVRREFGPFFFRGHFCCARPRI